MQQVDITVWSTKRADKRTLRTQQFEQVFVGLATRGMHQSPSSVASLYEIARENYSELGIIMREEIAKPRMSCVPEESSQITAKELSEFYTREMSAEATRIETEIHALLLAKQVPSIDRIIPERRIGFTQTIEIHNARFHQDLDRAVHLAKRILEQKKATHDERSASRAMSVGSLLVAIISLGYGYKAYDANRQEFFLRNRPYLAVSYSDLPKTLKNLPETVSIPIEIENTGDVPAIDVIHTVVVVSDKRLLLMVNAKNPTVRDSHLHYDYAKLDDSVINAKRKITFNVPIDKNSFIALANASDSYESGIVITIRFCGPWESPNERPYAYEEMLTPYMDGERVLYKFQKQRLQ